MGLALALPTAAAKSVCGPSPSRRPRVSHDLAVSGRMPHSRAASKLGVVLPRTVRDQYAIGTAVSRDRLRAGDIVFFDRLRHNGVYLGDGRLIHASTMDRAVRIAKLNEDWFKERWVGARRLQQAAALRGDGSATVSGPVERIARTSGSTQAGGKRYGAGLTRSPDPPAPAATVGS